MDLDQSSTAQVLDFEMVTNKIHVCLFDVILIEPRGWKISRYFRKYCDMFKNIGYFRYVSDSFDIFNHFTALDWVMSVERLVFKLYISECFRMGLLCLFFAF